MECDEMTAKIAGIIKEWEKLHPEEELIVISLPKNDPENRKRIITRLQELLSEEADCRRGCRDSGGCVQKIKSAKLPKLFAKLCDYF